MAAPAASRRAGCVGRRPAHAARQQRRCLQLWLAFLLLSHATAAPADSTARERTQQQQGKQPERQQQELLGTGMAPAWARRDAGRLRRLLLHQPAGEQQHQRRQLLEELSYVMQDEDTAGQQLLEQQAGADALGGNTAGQPGMWSSIGSSAATSSAATSTSVDAAQQPAGAGDSASSSSSSSSSPSAVGIAGAGAGEDSLAQAVASAAVGAAETGGTATAASPAGTNGSGAGNTTWQPRVLDSPVPKWPSLYAHMPLSAPSLQPEARPAAAAALQAAAARAKTPQGISTSSIPGLILEEKLLLARLLGHEVPGDFDEAGRLQPSNTEYWQLLEKQLQTLTPVKHMFESTWYKCGKLNADLVNRATNAYDMEVEALQHILGWLGFQEQQLPRPGEAASFDDLLGLLGSIGAQARLVTDPVPFLLTSNPHVDRNGMPVMIHMTFKDKGQFARHHMLSLASWAKENPDHAILMYDDDDLMDYIKAFDPTVLPLYSSLKTAVERADLWRYVVMCRHGGVYTDADTLCVRPIQEWNSENHNDAAALFGVEDVFKRDPGSGSTGWGVATGRFGVQFEQWTLAGAPNHPVYCNMHGFINQRIAEEATQAGPANGTGPTSEAENWSILHRTGPHVWTDSVLKWMHGQGIGFHEALVPGGRLVANNTRIMPGETFGCAAHFFSPGARLEEVYAMHMFRGVWRKRLDTGAEDEQARRLQMLSRPGF